MQKDLYEKEIENLRNVVPINEYLIEIDETYQPKSTLTEEEKRFLSDVYRKRKLKPTQGQILKSCNNFLGKAEDHNVNNFIDTLLVISKQLLKQNVSKKQIIFFFNLFINENTFYILDIFNAHLLLTKEVFTILFNIFKEMKEDFTRNCISLKNVIFRGAEHYQTNFTAEHAQLILKNFKFINAIDKAQEFLMHNSLDCQILFSDINVNHIYQLSTGLLMLQKSENYVKKDLQKLLAFPYLGDKIAFIIVKLQPLRQIDKNLLNTFYSNGMLLTYFNRIIKLLDKKSLLSKENITRFLKNNNHIAILTRCCHLLDDRLNQISLDAIFIQPSRCLSIARKFKYSEKHSEVRLVASEFDSTPYNCTNTGEKDGSISSDIQSDLSGSKNQIDQPLTYPIKLIKLFNTLVKKPEKEYVNYSYYNKIKKILSDEVVLLLFIIGKANQLTPEICQRILDFTNLAPWIIAILKLLNNNHEKFITPIFNNITQAKDIYEALKSTTHFPHFIINHIIENPKRTSQKIAKLDFLYDSTKTIKYPFNDETIEAIYDNPEIIKNLEQIKFALNYIKLNLFFNSEFEKLIVQNPNYSFKIALEIKDLANYDLTDNEIIKAVERFLFFIRHQNIEKADKYLTDVKTSLKILEKESILTTDTKNLILKHQKNLKLAAILEILHTNSLLNTKNIDTLNLVYDLLQNAKLYSNTDPRPYEHRHIKYFYRTIKMIHESVSLSGHTLLNQTIFDLICKNALTLSTPLKVYSLLKNQSIPNESLLHAVLNYPSHAVKLLKGIKKLNEAQLCEEFYPVLCENPPHANHLASLICLLISFQLLNSVIKSLLFKNPRSCSYLYKAISYLQIDLRNTENIKSLLNKIRYIHLITNALYSLVKRNLLNQTVFDQIIENPIKALEVAQMLNGKETYISGNFANLRFAAKMIAQGTRDSNSLFHSLPIDVTTQIARSVGNDTIEDTLADEIVIQYFEYP